MDTLKMQHFVHNYPGRQFPRFRALSTSEATELRGRLSNEAGLPPDVDGLLLVQRLHAESRIIEGVDPNNDSFDLTEAMRLAGIQPNAEVYVNWYRYDQIDRLRFEDLASYFNDVRYDSEDIDIFDDSLSWILMVMHYAQVAVIRLPLHQV